MGKVLIIDDEKQILGLLHALSVWRDTRSYRLLLVRRAEADGATFARGGIVRCVLAGW